MTSRDSIKPLRRWFASGWIETVIAAIILLVTIWIYVENKDERRRDAETRAAPVDSR